MQSVIKQLETVAYTYYNVNTVERSSSLLTVWTNVAQAMNEYIKDHQIVNLGNDNHHDLSCLYMTLLFPFYHFYSVSYKQVSHFILCILSNVSIFHVCDTIHSSNTLDLTHSK
jgi:hypothetical protein